MHPFERALLVSLDETEFGLTPLGPLPWADHLLNPRRLRGSDFLMRWSQGVWSENRMLAAVNATTEFHAIPYGPSGTAPDNDVRAFELYFEELEAAGLGAQKRPDLLVFKKADQSAIGQLVADLGGTERLPFHREDEDAMRRLLSMAIVGIECENSLWVSRKMKGFGVELKPQKRLGGLLGVPKALVLPTVIVKEEDRTSLQAWQDQSGVRVHIWHAFYDDAYGLAFDHFQLLVRQGSVPKTIQTFQAPGGATTRKVIFKTPYHHAYHLGVSTGEPDLVAAAITDANGHILPYVRFEGGDLQLTFEALDVLKGLAGDVR